jgi:hypothetical protein
MIRAQIASYAESADPFADDLRAWLRGEETAEAEAAGIVLADAILLHRSFLRGLGER